MLCSSFDVALRNVSLEGKRFDRFAAVEVADELQTDHRQAREPAVIVDVTFIRRCKQMHTAGSDRVAQTTPSRPCDRTGATVALNTLVYVFLCHFKSYLH